MLSEEKLGGGGGRLYGLWFSERISNNFGKRSFWKKILQDNLPVLWDPKLKWCFSSGEFLG